MGLCHHGRWPWDRDRTRCSWFHISSGGSSDGGSGGRGDGVWCAIAKAVDSAISSVALGWLRVGHSRKRARMWFRMRLRLRMWVRDDGGGM